MVGVIGEFHDDFSHWFVFDHFLHPSQSKRQLHPAMHIHSMKFPVGVDRRADKAPLASILVPQLAIFQSVTNSIKSISGVQI